MEAKDVDTDGWPISTLTYDVQTVSVIGIALLFLRTEITVITIVTQVVAIAPRISAARTEAMVPNVVTLGTAAALYYESERIPLST
jgi:hypothetical protein